MNTFQLWYLYFDSIFKKKNIRQIQRILKELLMERINENNWPKCKLFPPISNCFSLLQNFITKERNWVVSNCTKEDLEIIERDINTVAILLKIQKLYAQDYWNYSHKRVQASILHFYMILKQFIIALTGSDNNTLEECQKKQILCTKLKYLQKFFDSIHQQLRFFQVFLLKPQFKQEKSLTIEFLTEFAKIMEKIPCLKKKDLESTPTLLKYINNMNLVELQFQKATNRKKYDNRPRAWTQQIQNRMSLQKDHINENNYKQFFNGYGYQVKIRPKSSEDRFIFQDYFQDKTDIPIIFKFSKAIHQYSFIFKKPTITTQIQEISRERGLSYGGLQRQKQLFTPARLPKIKSRSQKNSISVKSQKKSVIAEMIYKPFREKQIDRVKQKKQDQQSKDKKFNTKKQIICIQNGKTNNKQQLQNEQLKKLKNLLENIINQK